MTSKKIKNQSSRFKVFHELMQEKVKQILLVSTSYEAWIMEEDCRLSEHIINEYRGLNLSQPPRLNWVSSLSAALDRIESDEFDLVITISRSVDLEAYRIGGEIKRKKPNMPVVLLTHQEALPETRIQFSEMSANIDRIFFWSGDAGILLAIIKCVEDQLNVKNDTHRAGIRVILFVEDSPFYLSSLLPILYKELVTETQAVIEDGLNEEHRLLSMRARPKILLANSYESAIELYERFNPYVLGVISDVRFPYQGVMEAKAGLKLLHHIKQDRFDIPLLLASSESHNAQYAAEIPAVFVDKNSPALNEKIASFLMEYLGFGDFIFKMPDGREIAKATDLYSLEKELEKIPDESFVFHCQRNDFSRWLFSLAEVELASQIRPWRNHDFDSIESHRRHLVQIIRKQRRHRLKGVIVDFDADKFDPDTGFLKIGKGSIGGKARGLAFMSSVLHRSSMIAQSFDKVDIFVPQTLVITTEGFDAYIRMNQLEEMIKEELPDEVVAERFMAGDIPEMLKSQLASYLVSIRYPLAVRSSSLLEDAQFKPYAGLYKTYILANDHEDIACRLDQLINAIKMVYASTFFKAPRAFSTRIGHRVENEKMAVIVQQVVGSLYGNFYYPAVSGVAQSQNYYPFSKMKPEDGIVNMALGLGKAVMEGERNLRFSPKFPEILPQRSTVKDILENSQRHFYALKMGEPTCTIGVNDAITLLERVIIDATDDYPIKLLSSTYDPTEDRIRDAYSSSGYPVITFASILKYKIFPIPEIITALLTLGREELGCPVEMEFAIEFSVDPKANARFAVLQLRPMSSREEMLEVEISDRDRDQAFCISHLALGNTINREMADIVYVKPESFDPARTAEIAKQIAEINSSLVQAGRKYILIGPGRWGSADHWLGIPVTWADICGVGAIVETVHPLLHAEPSHGSHFFHNITALGINYFNVNDVNGDHMDWQWLASLSKVNEKANVVHSVNPQTFTLKVDGGKGIGIIIDPSPVAASRAKTELPING
jgi:hypothetical protein